MELNKCFHSILLICFQLAKYIAFLCWVSFHHVHHKNEINLNILSMLVKMWNLILGCTYRIQTFFYVIQLFIETENVTEWKYLFEDGRNMFHFLVYVWIFNLLIALFGHLFLNLLALYILTQKIFVWEIFFSFFFFKLTTMHLYYHYIYPYLF